MGAVFESNFLSFIDGQHEAASIHTQVTRLLHGPSYIHSRDDVTVKTKRQGSVAKTRRHPDLGATPSNYSVLHRADLLAMVLLAISIYSPPWNTAYVCTRRGVSRLYGCSVRVMSKSEEG